MNPVTALWFFLGAFALGILVGYTTGIGECRIKDHAQTHEQTKEIYL